MTRDEFVNEVVLFGCKDLDIEPPTIEIIRGSFFDNDRIIAVARINEYKILFKESWYDHAELHDLARTTFHELRHFYQNKKIKELKKKNNATLLQWRKEFGRYIYPEEKTIEEYIKQDIERDANEYGQKKLKSFLEYKMK